MKTIEEIFRQLDGYFQNNEIEKVEPFLVACREEAKEQSEYGIYISVANELIGFYRSVTEFSKAFDTIEDVLLLMEELQLEHSEHFATTLLNAATAYRAAGKLEEAARYYKQALQIYEQTLAPGDYRFAGLYNNLGILLENMGEAQEAIKTLQKALEIVRGLPDSEGEQAISLTNLAMVWFQVQDSEQAEICLGEAVQLFEQKGAEADEHYHAALAGLGEAAFRRKAYTEALSYYEKALQELKKHYGETMSYAMLCDNCVAVCEQLGDMEKRQYYESLSQAVKKKYADEVSEKDNL